MFNFEKIFASVLLAGIIAMLSGFVAEKVVHPHDLKKDAVAIEGTAVAAGPAKKKSAEPILALIAEADIARGQKLSKACAACHSFDKGGVNKVGPNLWNIVDVAKGSKAGFSYSSALLSKGGTWSYESLNQFLYKPKKYISGTKMSYAGLKKPTDRAAMIAWLRTLADSPAALPDAASITAEQAAFDAE